jgi:hypothetical protein
MMATVCMWEQGCACVLGHSVVMCIFVCVYLWVQSQKYLLSNFSVLLETMMYQ